MPTPKKGARLGGSPAHQKLMLANLATSLFEHGRITTTEARARVLRPVAEKLITKAKKGDLHNRRQVLSTIHDKGIVHALFEEIAPRYAERPGGYTRITKIGPRKGDNAPMAVIELVTEEYSPKAASTPASKKAAAPSAASIIEQTPTAEQEPAAEEVLAAEEAPSDEGATDGAAAALADDAEAEEPAAEETLAAEEAPSDEGTAAPEADTKAGDTPAEDTKGDT